MQQQLSSQELATLKQIAYEEKLITSRLHPSTLEEKVQLFRPRMIEAAEENKTITYSEVTDGFSDLLRFDIGEVLGIIGLHEARQGRPLLPAVVVQATSGWPGHNYFSLVKKAGHVSGEVPPESAETARREMWRNHRDQVWNYEW
jgi:hypothetical protein